MSQAAINKQTNYSFRTLKTVTAQPTTRNKNLTTVNKFSQKPISVGSNVRQQSKNQQVIDLKNLIFTSDFILIGAGAGFSVDSGLKTFRDIAKIPYYEEMGLTYDDLCDPLWLKRNYLVFYGFWGSCYNAYQLHVPHEGYSNLITFLDKHDKDYYVYTSNIDGFFTNFVNSDQMWEFHGSLRYWQCSGPCNSVLYSLKNYVFNVDQTMHCRNPTFNDLRYNRINQSLLEIEGSGLPRCFYCKQLLRPHVLMFEDYTYSEEYQKEEEWKQVKKDIKNQKVLLLELGCGLKVPSLRIEFEKIMRLNLKQSVLLRINPGEVGLQRLTQGKDCAKRIHHIKQRGKEFLSSLKIQKVDCVEDILNDFQ